MLGCLHCVDACPVKDTLVLRTRRRGRAIAGWRVGAIVVGVFAAVTAVAMFTGHWHNGISELEYRWQFRQLLEPAAPAGAPRMR